MHVYSRLRDWTALCGLLDNTLDNCVTTVNSWCLQYPMKDLSIRNLTSPPGDGSCTLRPDDLWWLLLQYMIIYNSFHNIHVTALSILPYVHTQQLHITDTMPVPPLGGHSQWYWIHPFVITAFGASFYSPLLFLHISCAPYAILSHFSFTVNGKPVSGPFVLWLYLCVLVFCLFMSVFFLSFWLVFTFILPGRVISSESTWQST